MGTILSPSTPGFGTVTKQTSVCFNWHTCYKNIQMCQDIDRLCVLKYSKTCMFANFTKSPHEFTLFPIYIDQMCTYDIVNKIDIGKRSNVMGDYQPPPLLPSCRNFFLVCIHDQYNGQGLIKM